MSKRLVVLIAILLVGCKSENSDFSFIEDTIDDVTGEATEPPQIIGFTPTAETIRMIDSGTTTFAVTVKSTAGQDVVYEFLLSGSSVATGPDPFYVLNGAVAPEGLSELVVKATNKLGNTSKSFVIQKNRNPNIDSSSPPLAGNNVTCGGGSLTFNVSASDPDADGLAYTWKLNGATGVSDFAVASTGGTSQNIFSPSCALSGAVSVSVDIEDGFETTTQTWTVTVTNPSVAQVVAYSPLSNPVVITSSGAQDFSISATGKSPLSYVWRLDGTAIPGATNALLNLTAANLSVGDHTLEAVVNDPDSSDSRVFNVKRNAPPVVSNPSPNSASVKINYQSIQVFSVDVSDANGDSLTYNWRLNGATNAALSTSTTGTGAQAIFTPSSAMLGTNTIELTASDGTETATRSWTVQVNLFSQACNNLAAGQICTVFGSPGLGSGLNPQTQGDRVKVYPTDIIDDGTGNLFIADSLSDVIWYYNRSGADVTRLGQTIAAGQIRVLVGNGAEGSTSLPGSSNTNYQLYNPYSVAWDNAAGRLFIANYQTHRVLVVNSDGSVQHSLCSGASGNATANHPLNGAATSHACRFPTGVAWDATNNALYVSAFDQHYIKRFDLSDADPANWTGRLLVGRQNTGGAVSGGGEDGDIAPGTSGTIARINRPWGIQVDANGLVHFVENTGCQLRVANPTATARTFAGVGITVNPGKVVKIRGTYNNCNFDAGASGRLNRPRGFGLWQSAGQVLGWFIPMDTSHRLLFINNSGSSVTLGNQATASGHGQAIWGTGSAGYGGENAPARTNNINQAFSAAVSATGDTLFLADTGNHMIRTLRINATNGALGLTVGGGSKTGSSVGSLVATDRILMNSPSYLTYDSDNQALLFSDGANQAIRSVSLTTGASTNLIGGTDGAGNVEQVAPSDVNLRSPRGLVKVPFGVIYADNDTNAGGNRNCQIRALNQTTSTQDFFSSFINANRVSTIAGNYSLGCNAYSGEGGLGTNARLHNPSGLASDGTNLYIANYSTHCILKVAADGTITRHLGDCGNGGHNESGATASSTTNLLNLPRGLSSDPVYPGSGNLFIVDQTNSATGRIKYANFTAGDVSISGVTIPANTIRTLYTTAGYGAGVTAFADQICYTSGAPNNGSQGAHNVICTNRSDSLQNTTMRAGAINGATLSAGSQMYNEHEGVSASSSFLYGPFGIAFDQDGNLYIAEFGGHVVRMVKRWW